MINKKNFTSQNLSGSPINKNPPFKGNIKKFIIFGLVGAGATLIDWIVFNIIYSFTTFFIFSRIGSTLISMIFNFSMNRNITFSAQGGSIRKQLFKWIIVYVISISANITVGKIVLELLGESLLNANIAFVVGTAIAIPISFFGSMIWAFKKKKIKENYYPY